ncbi:hypothetical protein F4823DRAFT_564927 [Ustulina deusta]|nr:hypothetical protein F4823DRAFT_564927 [Ustulina deusta]
MVDCSPKHGLVLEHMANGTFRQSLQVSNGSTAASRSPQWACDATEGATAPPLKRTSVGVRGHPLRPTTAADEPSTAVTDLFALGSTIYEITSQQPYEDIDGQEVENTHPQ